MYFVGVDVGTGSARAGLFSSEGGLVRHTSREIKTWTGPEVGHSEQSTTDIWNAVCSAIRVSILVYTEACSNCLTLYQSQ